MIDASSSISLSSACGGEDERAGKARRAVDRVW
jgi:hypothetical protein